MEQLLHLGRTGQVADLRVGSVFFVGTATTIIRYAGFTILTDPNFLHRGDHVHLGYGLTAERLTDPAIELEQLPPVDLVVLSHMHEDHFDRLVQERLDHRLPIVSTPHAAKRLREQGFWAARALAPWQRLVVTKDDVVLRVTAMPGRHGPGVLNALLPPVMGSMLEFESPEGQGLFRMYISGDTLVGEHLQEIPRRFADIDLALLHLGGTRVFGIMLTMDGREGVEALRLVAPKVAIPIHYDDYTVFESPLADFVQAVREAGLEDRVHYLAHGETYQFTLPAARLPVSGPPDRG